ncbi:hypothetical protein EDB81DRAFT_756733 [Dactylonectria macrodidyma]|uniref:Uncharacterized protein n=1 Tax=Dactylonectria macrodidyma TaxID=307937 RepID=A0A9P9J8E4_9HYPO|nr:hypothetical protein EDB81DRAFT_756733 [Dactylonectria macrodidyma]
MATFAKWVLQRRADDDDEDTDWGYVNEDGYSVPWWYSETGVIVKWTVFLTITVLFMAWIIGGYLHARSRLKKGLPLLAYHRCLVSRRVRAQHDPSYQYPQPMYYPQPSNGYPMYNMPPPVYDPSRPPVYEPPAGATKIDPMQTRHSYQPPPGPPPASNSR